MKPQRIRLGQNLEAAVHCLYLMAWKFDIGYREEPFVHPGIGSTHWAWVLEHNGEDAAVPLYGGGAQLFWSLGTVLWDNSVLAKALNQEAELPDEQDVSHLMALLEMAKDGNTFRFPGGSETFTPAGGIPLHVGPRDRRISLKSVQKLSQELRIQQAGDPQSLADLAASIPLEDLQSLGGTHLETE